MPARVRNFVIWVVFIFLVYAAVTNPDRAADTVRSIWDFIYGVFNGFARFFERLAS
ncbi:hypothetical protein Cph01nite_04560 [Cellulomonas phragmiteti]|uniref:Uncharacterized protein n=2 Tax=Cellulomonas phragmiteti TaxID=478780 RepID=A0ABQ4DH61_9CELL|nr:hypothetical protein Cph01nite_04560 [Cellulomonas phragmiteti]